MSEQPTPSTALQNIQDIQITVVNESVRNEFAVAVDAAKGIISVGNDADFERSGAAQTLLTKLVSDFDKKRLELTRPIDALKDRVMAEAKAFTLPARTELERVKSLNNAYATAKARAAEAERRRIAEEERRRAEAEFAAQQQAEAEAKAQAEAARAVFGDSAEVTAQPVPQDTPAPTHPVEPTLMPRVTAPRTESNNIAKVWKFEVTDTAKVPREFLTVDEAKIRSLVDYHKKIGDIESLTVAGVRFYWESSVRSKA